MVEKKLCWKCGKDTGEKITTHHAIPLRFNPVYNFQIPLHRKCHDEIDGIGKEAIKESVKTNDLSEMSKLMVYLSNKLHMKLLSKKGEL